MRDVLASTAGHPWERRKVFSLQVVTSLGWNLSWTPAQTCPVPEHFLTKTLSVLRREPNRKDMQLRRRR